MLLVCFVGWLAERAAVVRCAILQVRRREVGRGVGERTSRDVVLVVAEPAVTTQSAVILVMIVHVMALLGVVVAVKGLGNVHATEGLMRGAAIEQAMILPVVAMAIEHVVGIVRRRVRARRSIRRRGVGVGEELSGVANGRAVAVVQIPGVGGLLLGVVEELAAGIEPVERIGHQRSETDGGEE